MARAETDCYQEMASALGDVTIGDLVNRPLDDPAVLAAARSMLEIPTTGYDRPVFLGQGLADEMVPAPLALKLAANLQPVELRGLWIR
ncbi:hypothetical protein [Rhodococcus globerulus]|uniref:Uncharacterized protein n=1 Tax=Rhodococcus globerulus TaxID=33008 RepID=A0ABU4C4P8_RHOGO|nr:hypothetical protein [Rhodococcus globerulus]MDV6271380.1 hypothetical protein [Rhodococcus globerulus]